MSRASSIPRSLKEDVDEYEVEDHKESAEESSESDAQDDYESHLDDPVTELLPDLSKVRSKKKQWFRIVHRGQPIVVSAARYEHESVTVTIEPDCVEIVVYNDQKSELNDFLFYVHHNQSVSISQCPGYKGPGNNYSKWLMAVVDKINSACRVKFCVLNDIMEAVGTEHLGGWRLSPYMRVKRGYSLYEALGFLPADNVAPGEDLFTTASSKLKLEDMARTSNFKMKQRIQKTLSIGSFDMFMKSLKNWGNEAKYYKKGYLKLKFKIQSCEQKIDNAVTAFLSTASEHASEDESFDADIHVFEKLSKDQFFRTKYKRKALYKINRLFRKYANTVRFIECSELKNSFSVGIYDSENGFDESKFVFDIADVSDGIRDPDVDSDSEPDSDFGCDADGAEFDDYSVYQTFTQDSEQTFSVQEFLETDYASDKYAFGLTEPLVPLFRKIVCFRENMANLYKQKKHRKTLYYERKDALDLHAQFDQYRLQNKANMRRVVLRLWSLAQSKRWERNGSLIEIHKLALEHFKLETKEFVKFYQTKDNTRPVPVWLPITSEILVNPKTKNPAYRLEFEKPNDKAKIQTKRKRDKGGLSPGAKVPRLR